MRIGFIVGVVVLMAIMVVSRRITENANKLLDSEQKAGLVDLFSDLRKNSPVFILLLIVVFFANLFLEFIPSEKALIGYFMILVGYQIYLGQRTYAVLTENNYPKEFIRAQLISSSLRMIGIFILMGFFLFY